MRTNGRRGNGDGQLFADHLGVGWSSFRLSKTDEMPTRTYIKATDEAQRAVAEIARLVRGGVVDATISVYVETMAIAVLEG